MMEETEDLWEKIRRWYGDEVAQEAVLQTLEYRGDCPPYLAVISKILDQIGYEDRLLGFKKRKRWRREDTRLDNVQVARLRSALDPFAMVCARQALAAVPEWILRKHAETGMICQHRCPHPMSRWFYGKLGRYSGVRCRDCLAAGSRTLYWRRQGKSDAQTQAT